eukprot:scaffold12240_cov170-Amphora_coffeaeformis.AAC.7
MWSTPGIEPGTSSTLDDWSETPSLRKNHTPRPSGLFCLRKSVALCIGSSGTKHRNAIVCPTIP